jgi:Holliday junction resolvasome RuvABC ATP-dependent DNA helicase subunit
MNTTNINPETKRLLDFNETLFANMVGQERAKRELRFHLDNYAQSHRLPSTMLLAPRGQGKTTMAREIAKGLHQFDENGQPIFVEKDGVTKPKRKAFVEVNCSSLKNVKQFINGFIVPYVQDKDVTLFFDEASEIPHDISMALLSILETNADMNYRSTFAHDDYMCEFDFRRQSFIFATTESQRVFHALMDRLERVTLSDYTISELAQILQRNIKGIACEDLLLNEIATVLRGNARDARKMADKISSCASHKGVFTRSDWNGLKHTLSIIPLGLNVIEVKILRCLHERPEGLPLTALSAQTGMSRDALQKNEELYLQRHGLMEITPRGRMLTGKGHDYLKVLGA